LQQKFIVLIPKYMHAVRSIHFEYQTNWISDRPTFYSTSSGSKLFVRSSTVFSF